MTKLITLICEVYMSNHVKFHFDRGDNLHPGLRGGAVRPRRRRAADRRAAHAETAGARGPGEARGSRHGAGRSAPRRDGSGVCVRRVAFSVSIRRIASRKHATTDLPR